MNFALRSNELLLLLGMQIGLNSNSNNDVSLKCIGSRCRYQFLKHIALETFPTRAVHEKLRICSTEEGVVDTDDRMGAGEDGGNSSSPDKHNEVWTEFSCSVSLNLW